LVRGEGQVVFILGLLGDVLDEDVDLLLDVVLLERDDVDEIGVLEDLGRLELGGQRHLGPGPGGGGGAVGGGGAGRQQAKERRCE